MTDTPPSPEDAPLQDTAADASAQAPQHEAPQQETAPAEAAEESSNPLAPPPVLPAGQRLTLSALPAYARSLLKVRVPVVVTLATRTESIENITRMGPGTILQFDKSCEDPLELEAGGQPLAVGEAVKVGDKFGLRIQAMLLPHERFQTVGKPRSKKPGKKAG